jgi:putative membrane protein
MMYYGGAGWMGWIGMGLAMVAFWGVIIFLVVWAIRSFSQPPAQTAAPTALNVLRERLARGEITPEEYAQRKQLIQGTG